MKLLISPTSPYARKAHIVILEKQIACSIEAAVPWDNDPIVMQNNPLRKIPILLTDNGNAIVDSRVICEYLEGLGTAPQLLPNDPEARIATQTRIAIAEGAMDGVLAIIMSGRVSPDMATDAWKTWLMDKVAATLTYFENNLSATEMPDMADITLGCLLGTLDFRMPAYDWKSSHPQLSARWQVWSQRPSFIQTVPKT